MSVPIVVGPTAHAPEISGQESQQVREGVQERPSTQSQADSPTDTKTWALTFTGEQWLVNMRLAKAQEQSCGWPIC